jgi:hypothetical protein
MDPLRERDEKIRLGPRRKETKMADFSFRQQKRVLLLLVGLAILLLLGSLRLLLLLLTLLLLVGNGWRWSNSVSSDAIDGGVGRGRRRVCSALSGLSRT